MSSKMQLDIFYFSQDERGCTKNLPLSKDIKSFLSSHASMLSLPFTNSGIQKCNKWIKKSNSEGEVSPAAPLLAWLQRRSIPFLYLRNILRSDA